MKLPLKFAELQLAAPSFLNRFLQLRTILVQRLEWGGELRCFFAIVTKMSQLALKSVKSELRQDS